MQSTSAGELVTVAGDGPPLDGIVFDTPSTTKTVVAVVDRGRGPVFRTVHPRTLTVRATEGGDDHALRLLIRRTPVPGARRRPQRLRLRAGTLGTHPRGDAPHDRQVSRHRMPGAAWPDLRYEDWSATCDTLHAHTQVLGKLAVALAPPEPQLQHAALRLTARGWETGAAAGARRLGRARRGARPAHPRGRRRAQRRSRAPRRADARPGGRRGHARAARTRSASSPARARSTRRRRRCRGACRSTRTTSTRPTTRRRSRPTSPPRRRPRSCWRRSARRTAGASTPVNAWWGSFDLAVNLFSGAPAEPPSDDFIMRNAMDSQEVAVGWWPGDPRYGKAAFYAYAHPAPDGFSAATLEPAAARWEPALGEYVLDWDDVRASADPHAPRSSSRARRSATPARSASGTRRWRPAPRASRRRSSEPGWFVLLTSDVIRTNHPDFEAIDGQAKPPPAIGGDRMVRRNPPASGGDRMVRRCAGHRAPAAARPPRARRRADRPAQPCRRHRAPRVDDPDQAEQAAERDERRGDPDARCERRAREASSTARATARASPAAQARACRPARACGRARRRRCAAPAGDSARAGRARRPARRRTSPPRRRRARRSPAARRRARPRC